MTGAVDPHLVGAAVGALLGAGVLLVLWWVRARRPTLDQRLAPYLRPRPTGSALLTGPPTGAGLRTLERVLAPVMADALHLVERLGSPSADVRRRLLRAGSPMTIEQFRAEQVVWGVLGAASGLALGLLAMGRGVHPAGALVLVVANGLAAVVARDAVLSHRVRVREQRLLAELPTVAELLALAVGAGEGALGALERVARTTRGELTTEVRAVLADVRAGSTLVVALERLADRTGLVPLTRFCEAVAVSVDRGTPLADVLRAQASDVREAGRTALMETGGRKEVLMMVPVVFLVLPVTVVFAVYPGLAALRLEL